MGRASKSSLNRGCWSPAEDMLLRKYVETHGVERWNTIALNAGLMRSGKSCRLRWMNYLRPNVKLGDISADEEELIIRLHKLLGNRWSLIAGRVPGRTDNEIKNYWNIHLSKKLETRHKIPISRRKRSRPLDCTDHENPMSMQNSTNGNLDSRSADAAATNTDQQLISSSRDSIPTPVNSREQAYSGPDLWDFRLCKATHVMSGLIEPSPLLTDELINAKISSPVVDRVNVSYEIRNLDGFNADQGVSTSGFENLSVGSPCSDLYLSSFWTDGSDEMQDQWFPCTYF